MMRWRKREEQHGKAFEACLDLLVKEESQGKFDITTFIVGYVRHLAISTRKVL